MSEDYEESVDNFYVSWSDLVTLLLVFFVYLYSISEIDVVKFLEAQGSMSEEISVDGATNLIEDMKQEQAKLAEIKQEIDEYIQAESLQDVFSVDLIKDSLEINLGNVLLFELGESSLKPKAKVILVEMSKLFAKINSRIIIEGHTDNIPIKTEKYPSNWELSAARAASVVRYLVKKGVPEKSFLVVGYNQFSPLVPNTSNANRSKNRRVKLIVKTDPTQFKRQRIEPLDLGLDKE